MWLHLALSWADSSPSKMAAELFSLAFYVSLFHSPSYSLSLFTSISVSLFLCLSLLLCLSLPLCFSLSLSPSLARPLCLLNGDYLLRKRKEKQVVLLRSGLEIPEFYSVTFCESKQVTGLPGLQEEGTPIPPPPGSSHMSEQRWRSWAALRD